MSEEVGMVERLARIVWDARMKRGVELGFDGRVWAWEEENEVLHENVRIEVRAVLEAIETSCGETLQALKNAYVNLSAMVPASEAKVCVAGAEAVQDSMDALKDAVFADASNPTI